MQIEKPFRKWDRKYHWILHKGVRIQEPEEPEEPEEPPGKSETLETCCPHLEIIIFIIIIITWVNPGTAEVGARALRLTSMFTKDDLPTFDRPTNTTSGSASLPDYRCKRNTSIHPSTELTGRIHTKRARGREGGKGGGTDGRTDGRKSGGKKKWWEEKLLLGKSPP